MLCNKLTEASAESISKRVAVYFLKDLFFIEVVCLFEQSLFFSRHVFPDIIYQQGFSQGRAAAFIAQYKAQRIDIMRDVYAIVQAGIGAGA